MTSAVLAILLTLQAGHHPAEESRVVRRSMMMGTWCTVETSAPDRSRALRAAESALAAGERVDARLSTWRTDSELARFNRAPAGSWQPVSPELGRDLARAIELTELTEGAFHLATGRLVSTWDLRGPGRVPTAAEIQRARPPLPHPGLQLDAGVARRLDDRVLVEEGGFGKGIALAAMVDAAVDSGARSVMVDLGGQIAVAGQREAPVVEIAHPRWRDRSVALLELTRSSVATSGGSERSRRTDAGFVHHILDPRTGRPATFPGSATVVSDDPVEADAIATALVVLGWQEGRAWLRRHPQVSAFLAQELDEQSVLAATPDLLPALSAHPGMRIDVIPRAGPGPEPSAAP